MTSLSQMLHLWSVARAAAAVGRLVPVAGRGDGLCGPDEGLRARGADTAWAPRVPWWLLRGSGEEDDAVKRQVVAVMAAGVLALSAAGGAAAQVEPNPGTPQSVSSANCIAIFSSTVIRNGQAPTLGQNAAGGARGAEIKALQEVCNNANQK